ncbi:PAS domain S-box protein [Kitasatospora arboriphila]
MRTAASALVPAEPAHVALLAVGDEGTLRADGDGPIEVEPVRESRLVPVATLDAGLAARLEGAPSALICPLVLEKRPSGDPLIGALVVGGTEHRLTALWGTLDILAGQAALAVERVVLNDEINRRNSELYFRTLVQSASDVILILRADDTIRYASSSADRVLGYPSLDGQALTDLVPPEDSRAVNQALLRMRTREQAEQREHWRLLRGDRTVIEAEVRWNDLRDDPTVGGLVLTLRDVTDQRQMERELTHRAFHDSLTGLANRVLFQDRVGHALSRSG